PPAVAASRVRSVEPVSTTIISSTRSATEARQADRFASSFLAIIHNESRAMVEFLYLGAGFVQGTNRLLDATVHDYFAGFCGSALATSHSFTFRSVPPEANQVPSGEKARA